MKRFWLWLIVAILLIGSIAIAGVRWISIPPHTFWNGAMACDSFAVVQAWHLAEGAQDWHGIWYNGHHMKMTEQGFATPEETCEACYR